MKQLFRRFNNILLLVTMIFFLVSILWEKSFLNSIAFVLLVLYAILDIIAMDDNKWKYIFFYGAVIFLVLILSIIL